MFGQNIRNASQLGSVKFSRPTEDGVYYAEYCNLHYSLLFTVTFITLMHAGPDCTDKIKQDRIITACDAGDNLRVFLCESGLFPLTKQE